MNTTEHGELGVQKENRVREAAELIAGLMLWGAVIAGIYYAGNGLRNKWISPNNNDQPIPVETNPNAHTGLGSNTTPSSIALAQFVLTNGVRFNPK